MHGLLFTILLISAVSAEYCPAKSGSRYLYPSQFPPCQAEESSPGDIIQLAECAKNTRVNGEQYFALFILVDDQHITSHGGPYGRCFAWACALDPNTQFEFDERVVSLFWDSPQTGTLPLDPSNCIKDPQTAECGCEVSGSGDFVPGSFGCPFGQNGRLGCGEPSLVACGFELDGVGVGTWNIARGDRSGAGPQDPVSQCWLGRDFDRNNQPVGSGDQYICVAGGGTGQGLGGGDGGGFGGGGFGGGSGGGEFGGGGFGGGGRVGGGSVIGNGGGGRGLQNTGVGSGLGNTGSGGSFGNARGGTALGNNQGVSGLGTNQLGGNQLGGGIGNTGRGGSFSNTGSSFGNGGGGSRTGGGLNTGGGGSFGNGGGGIGNGGGGVGNGGGSCPYNWNGGGLSGGSGGAGTLGGGGGNFGSGRGRLGGGGGTFGSGGGNLAGGTSSGSGLTAGGFKQGDLGTGAGSGGSD